MSDTPTPDELRALARVAEAGWGSIDAATILWVADEIERLRAQNDAYARHGIDAPFVKPEAFDG